MNMAYKTFRWGITCGIVVLFLVGTGQPVTAQEVSQEILDALYNRLSAAERARIAGSKGVENLVGIEIVGRPTWETASFRIDEVITTQADTPLVIAEQYSTNCASGEMQRTFEFSKTKEHTEEVSKDHSHGFTVAISNSWGKDLAVWKTEISTEISTDHSWSFGTSTSDTESTTWTDSVTVTIEPGKIGRGRLLVTENVADVDFTQYVRIDGNFRPLFANELPQVEFTNNEGLVERHNNSSGSAGANVQNSLQSIKLRPDKRLELFWAKAGNLYAGYMIALESRKGNSIAAPEMTLREDWVRDIKGYEPSSPGTPSSSSFSTDQEGTWFEVNVTSDWDAIDSYHDVENKHAWHNGITSFKIIDLSKPYACLYQAGDWGYALPANWLDSGADEHWYIRCFNAGDEEEFIYYPFNGSFNAAIVSKGLQVQLWKQSDLGGEPTIKLPDDPDSASYQQTSDGSEWYTANFDEGSVKIKVVSTGGDALPLLSQYLRDDSEREFSLKGRYHSVAQTNARAVAYTEPASWEDCCFGASEGDLCEGLQSSPKEVTVQIMGNRGGSIEYGAYRYRIECAIRYPSAGSLDALVKAIPLPGFVFSGWTNEAGEALTGTYSPEPGETVYANFEKKGIDAAFTVGGRLYFLSGGQYAMLRPDSSGKYAIAAGYPKPISAWPRHGLDMINAVCRANDVENIVYLFSQDQYTRYDMNDLAPTSLSENRNYPLSITGNWLQLAFDRIDTAFLWKKLGSETIPSGMQSSDQIIYLVNGEQIIRYNISRHAPFSGYPKAIADEWPDLGLDGIDAAVHLDADPDIIHFFHRDLYVKYNIETKTLISGPRSITEDFDLSGFLE